MAIEWLAGNRLRGTTSERPNLGLPSGSVGGWVEVGRTTLGSAGDDITVSSLPDKRYYMVLCNSLPTGTTGERIRLGYNSIDTGSNYANRASKAGASDVTSTSETSYDINEGLTPNLPTLDVTYIANLSGKEKLMVNHHTYESTAGAGTAPYRIESVGKWANTSNPLNIFNKTNVEAGSFNTGSEAVILGWDPADTHTSNFWEELASVELSSAGDVLSSGSFSTKKYLWCQVYTKNSGTTNAKFTFNNDTGNNYAYRHNLNGSE
jgi:hypothetical protein